MEQKAKPGGGNAHEELIAAEGGGRPLLSRPGKPSDDAVAFLNEDRRPHGSAPLWREEERRVRMKRSGDRAVPQGRSPLRPIPESETKSGLLRDQGGDVLFAIHPRCGGRTAPGNHVMDALIVIGQIACENWLMVGDPVAQMADALQVSIGLAAALGDAQSSRCSWKDRPEVCVPKTAILSGSQDVLPESKFELRDDLASRRKLADTGLKIVGRVVAKPTFRARQASDKTIVPGPVRAMDGFDGFCDPIANRDFTDLERNDQGRGNVEIPFVELERLFPVIAFRLEIGSKARRRDNFRQILKFSGSERQGRYPVCARY